MSTRKSYYVICYDISDPKRLNKIARIMTKFCERVLYSVFEGELTLKQKLDLHSRVSKIMDFEDDSVIYFTLCDNCIKKIHSVGKRIGIKLDKEFDII